MGRDRFEFGRNWERFSHQIDAEVIRAAESSLREFTGLDDFRGMRVIDIGCGSGLFTLAFSRMGAAEVLAFDFDPDSVATTRKVVSSAPPTGAVTVQAGDVLDRAMMESLGQFDFVYSWGVLHHTGDLWTALENAADRVKPDGLLYIALYNDQGWKSRVWLRIKQLYNAWPKGIRELLVLPYFASSLPVYAWRKLTGRLRNRHARGMTLWTDARDWIGGLPFQVASAEQVDEYLGQKGFQRAKAVLTASHGCNEFLYRRKG